MVRDITCIVKTVLVMILFYAASNVVINI